MALECNIEKSDRTNRLVIGAILIIGAILGFGRFWAILIGIALMVEGYLGWCGIPILLAKFKKDENHSSEPPAV